MLFCVNSLGTVGATASISEYPGHVSGVSLGNDKPGIVFNPSGLVMKSVRTRGLISSTTTAAASDNIVNASQNLVHANDATTPTAAAASAPTAVAASTPTAAASTPTVAASTSTAAAASSPLLQQRHVSNEGWSSDHSRHMLYASDGAPVSEGVVAVGLDHRSCANRGASRS